MHFPRILSRVLTLLVFGLVGPGPAPTRPTRPPTRPHIRCKIEKSAKIGNNPERELSGSELFGTGLFGTEYFGTGNFRNGIFPERNFAERDIYRNGIKI